MHEVKELGFVTTGGRAQGHPAGAVRLAAENHWCFLATPGGRGLMIVSHGMARYRVTGRLPIDFPGVLAGLRADQDGLVTTALATRGQ